jgi:putative nucleotidyltransferase with HDIG domain
MIFVRKSDFWKLKIKEWQLMGNFAELLPEVAALQGVQQPEKYHTEGDAFIHSMLAVEAVAATADERVFWAVLLHDVGKASTTRMVEGRWRAWGHDQVGAEMVPEILQRFGLIHLVEDVAWLVKHHGFMLSWGGDLNVLTKKQKRFCGHPLFDMLVEVATADATASYGCNTKLTLLQNIVGLCKS